MRISTCTNFYTNILKVPEQALDAHAPTRFRNSGTLYNAMEWYTVLNRPVEGVASLLEIAAESLRHPDGHIYYLGTDLFGVLGYATCMFTMTIDMACGGVRYEDAC